MNGKVKCFTIGVLLMIILTITFKSNFFISKNEKTTNTNNIVYNYIKNVESITKNLLVMIDDIYKNNKINKIKSNKSKDTNIDISNGNYENTQSNSSTESHQNETENQNITDNGNSFNNQEVKDNYTTNDKQPDIPNGNNYNNENLPDNDEQSQSAQSNENLNKNNTTTDNENHENNVNYKIYPTIEECDQAGIELGFKYPEDIINTFCFSVAENGKLLGYRIDINCKSGNCDKYE